MSEVQSETEHLLSHQQTNEASDANEFLAGIVNDSLDVPLSYTPSPIGTVAPVFSETNSSLTLSTDAPVINCRVCHALVHLENKLHLHVIKCHACGEATPIRPAPPMKKYVRCPCKCLLICNVSSQRVVCPRVNCRRVISLLPVLTSSGNLTTNERGESSSINLRIICAYCHFSFVPSKSFKRFQFCPHCLKTSFTSPSFKKKFLCYIGLFLFFIFCVLTAALFLLLFLVKRHSYVYVLMGLISVFDFVLLVSFIWISRKKASKIERFSLQYT